MTRSLQTIFAAAITLSSLAALGGNMSQTLSQEQMDQRIREHRTAEVTLTVLAPNGKPLAGAAVTVRQVRHKFLFGSNAGGVGRFEKPQLEAAFRQRYVALMNFATVPFYWGGYEQQPGQTQAAQRRVVADWCKENRIVAKGHPLVWHNVVPTWLAGKPTDKVQDLLMGRITREVKEFTGSVDAWDVVNEPVVMPAAGGDNAIAKLCNERGRDKLIAASFAAARKANPKALLVLNDYDNSPSFAAVVQSSLAAGASIDAIGLQTHMHKGFFGAKDLWEICERFAKFKKPIHFTELTILSGELMKRRDNDWFTRRASWPSTPEGLKRQAVQAVEVYTTLFSHPSVEAITWWDFAEHRSWMNAPSGLLTADMTPKPAYTALMNLIKKKWWTPPQALTTDAAGRAAFHGYLGDYEIITPAGAAAFEVAASGKAAVEVRLMK
ncbi:MAG: endo-1,4-beta-xylanase [Planctomycetaceae bacterium]|nr:endo-1,4-beta-xylanase [Planctomycetaceae bacterium]